MTTETSTYTYYTGAQETVTLTRGLGTPSGHALLKIEHSDGQAADCYVNTAWLRDRLDDLGEPRRIEPRDEREHIGTEGEADWHGMYLAENRRAEKAERERDKARDGARVAFARFREVDKARQEVVDELYSLRVAEPRPLTPDAITDEMVERAVDAADRHPVAVVNRAIMREAITAALTAPTRPEGAEEVEALIEESLPGDALSDAQVRALADYLAARLTDPTRREA